MPRPSAGPYDRLSHGDLDITIAYLSLQYFKASIRRRNWCCSSGTTNKEQQQTDLLLAPLYLLGLWEESISESSLLRFSTAGLLCLLRPKLSCIYAS